MYEGKMMADQSFDTVKFDRGRVLLAVEKYKKSEASLEKAARLAGVSLARIMDILAEYGVEANLDYEDYLKGLKTIRKVW